MRVLLLCCLFRSWLATGWVISPSRKRVASHRKASVLDSSVTNSTVQPTQETALDPTLYHLQGRLLKSMRRTCQDYEMLQDGDHIMVCVSGGKDSATLWHLLTLLQSKLVHAGINFDLTAVHVDQKQPGYDGAPLHAWFQNCYPGHKFRVVEEDTYSVVLNKTAVGKSYCTVCSRLRRGILYSTAMELGCNKIALGHHADDCLETFLLNSLINGGSLSAMPARYTSQRGSLGVLRPLIGCWEDDIAEYAAGMQFPILPCNLCSSQETTLQRPQMKLLLSSLGGITPQAKQNLWKSLHRVKPSHLLDQSLREQCGMDPVTGALLDGPGEDNPDDEDNILMID